MTLSPALLVRVDRFLRQEVDPADRAELEQLVSAARDGDESSRLEIEERFSGPLTFGTAGIRGILGAGEGRMNRSVVLRVTYGLGTYLLEKVPEARTRGVAIARDGRARSDVFQEDAAATLNALGIPVYWIDGPEPTPLLAFTVRHVGAAAGIVITASHNPPAYNGYKVYWGNGAQIVPPIDIGIAECIEAAPGANEIPRQAGRYQRRDDLKEAYLRSVAQLASVSEIAAGDIRIAYTALHGVGQPLFLAAMHQRGFRHVFPVDEQATPDPEFRTVTFPNPEEPGALDLVLEMARTNGCDLVLANDPDADRLGVAVREAEGAYRVLNGNEIGVLLAEHVLSHTREQKPLVVSTVVSSRMLSKMAAAHGARYLDTLTGFKWIENEAMRIEAQEGCRFVFGYEEALGYALGTAVRDKDGISAGVVIAEMAAGLRARGETLLDALDSLHRRYGNYVSQPTSVMADAASGAMARLRDVRPRRLGSERVTKIQDLVEGNVLLFDLADGGRVAVRPSGTEPKIKFYLEIVGGTDHEATKARLGALRRDLLDAAGLSHEVH
jgi:phosphomannomutase